MLFIGESLNLHDKNCPAWNLLEKEKEKYVFLHFNHLLSAGKLITNNTSIYDYPIKFR
jgi:hypothetical protein